MRQVLNALFYLLRSGCAWRYLPREFPPWQTVYDYFRQWQQNGAWLQIYRRLIDLLRLRCGRHKKPSVLIVDSQSVRSAQGESRGFDGYKHVQGRKRHIFVDSLGLLQAVLVSAANLQDRREAEKLFRDYPASAKRSLQAIYADRAYQGAFSDSVFAQCGFFPTITSVGYDEQSKVLWQSNLKPMRWVVERAFAWFNHFRRLSRDYEKNTSHSQAMLYLSMTRIILSRLRHSASPSWNN
jgi:putative transposase